MYNYLQKFFLIFLCLNTSCFIYSMENENHDLDSLHQALSCAVKKYNSYVYAFCRGKYKKEIKQCLAQGANINYNLDGDTLVGLAVKASDYDLLKYLIRHNANINQIHYFHKVPLKYAIENLNGITGYYKEHCLKIIKKLCDSGTSLILRDFAHENKLTAFHHLTHNTKPKEAIEIIITHARFDVYGQVDEQFLTIIQKLEKHVENIDKVLQFPAYLGLTALQCRKMYNEVDKSNYPYDAEIELLLNGSKLRKDMIDFKNSFPNLEQIPKDNLVLAICDAQKLLHK